jgi:hypothetical protein
MLLSSSLPRPQFRVTAMASGRQSLALVSLPHDTTPSLPMFITINGFMTVFSIVSR